MILPQCIELENWQTAAVLYALKEQYDQALKYQLKAAAAYSNRSVEKYSSSESTSTLSFSENKLLAGNGSTSAFQSVVNDVSDSLTTSASMSFNQSADYFQRQDSSTTIEEEDDDLCEEEEDDLCEEERVSRGDESVVTSSLSSLTDDQGTRTLTMTQLRQTPNEEDDDDKDCSTMTLESQSELQSSTINPADQPSCRGNGGVVLPHENDAPISNRQYSFIDEISHMQMKPRASASDACSHFANKQQLVDDYTSMENEYNCTIDNYINIVEKYISYCKKDSVSVLRDLLFEVLDFWLDQALPVSTLESFLREQWDVIHYPLGVLLFGQDLTDKTVGSEKMLCRLSTEFNLLLCTSMVEHVSDKNELCWEMIDIVAGLNWAAVHSVTDSSNDITLTLDNAADNRLPAQLIQDGDKPKHALHLINILDELHSPQATHPYIDFTFSEKGDEEIRRMSETVAFTCGHRYDGGSVVLETTSSAVVKTLQQSALTNTADAVATMFNQHPTVRHFACPNCVLSSIETQLI